MQALNANDNKMNLICKTGSNVEKENTIGRTDIINGNNFFIFIMIKNKHSQFFDFKIIRNLAT
jgi:spermidine/putrescine-binding protein